MSNIRDEEYRAALAKVHEGAPYQLQRRDPQTKIWRNVGKVSYGREAAMGVLNAAKKEKRIGESGGDFRTLPKNEADAYAQGLHDGAALEGKPVRRRLRHRKPLMALPEHL